MTTKTVPLPTSKLSDVHEFTSGCGRMTLVMTLGQALGASHQGQCDADVAALVAHPAIAAQLSAVAPDHIRTDLTGYGAWEADELADDAQNLRRWVWLAACDIRENQADTRIG